MLFQLISPFKLKNILTHIVVGKTKSQETETYPEKMANTGRHRSDFVCCRSLFKQQISSIPWCSNGNWIRNIKQIISLKEESLRFFRDYHNHSKEIVKIITDGFGRTSGILGDCKYHSGLVIIERSKEPEIGDIGLARNHLRDGYPDIWKLKTEAELESNGIIKEIENVKTDFESKIIHEMERETDETHTKLVRKDYLSSLSDIFQSCYYNELISEIFYEIDIRMSGKKPRYLYPHFDHPTIRDNEGKEHAIIVYKLSFGEQGDIMIVIQEKDKVDIQSRINRLLSNADLNDMVSKYTQLKNRLDTNERRNEFFKKIDSLYKTIYLEGESLDNKGKCSQCPLEPV